MIFLSLGLDKCEDIERDNSSLAAFMPSVEECISERECRKFEEGVINKKLNWLCIKRLARM